eukprot:gene6683-7999_t
MLSDVAVSGLHVLDGGASCTSSGREYFKETSLRKDLRGCPEDQQFVFQLQVFHSEVVARDVRRYRTERKTAVYAPCATVHVGRGSLAFETGPTAPDFILHPINDPGYARPS